MLKPAWGQDLIGLKVSTFSTMARVLGQGGGFDAFFHRFACEFFYQYMVN